MSKLQTIQSWVKAAVAASVGTGVSVVDEWSEADRADKYIYVAVGDEKAAAPRCPLATATLTLAAGVRSTDEGSRTALEGLTAKLEALLDAWQSAGCDQVALAGVTLLGAANGNISAAQYGDGFVGRTASVEVFFKKEEE